YKDILPLVLLFSPKQRLCYYIAAFLRAIAALLSNHPNTELYSQSGIFNDQNFQPTTYREGFRN
ncbi:MAG: hypothetical protein ACYT04_69845, partial [Nostoc sp.]